MIESVDESERLVKQESCFNKLIFHLYRQIARFYGINYDEDDGYTFKSRNITSDIKRLFYINHEDDFTAN